MPSQKTREPRSHERNRHPQPDPRGLQPAAAAARLQHVPREPPAHGSGAARGRRLGRGEGRAARRGCGRGGARFGAAETLGGPGEGGGGELLNWGRPANESPPQLKTHDRYGNRIDEVEFHPAWHWLMEMSVKHGPHALPWIEPRRGAHAARAALMLSGSAVESGHGCPISMTYACVP